jgi:predicted nucleotidyltransferase
MEIPKLTINTLSHVVADAVDLCPDILAVGLVGSFARGEQKHSSDVDLLIKCKTPANFHNILNNFGVHVQHILEYQFNKNLDIIRYDLAIDRANRNPANNEAWFCRETFLNMLKEVKWLYEG